MRLKRAPAAPDDQRAFACHDRVRVPDGRIGEVIGFYRAGDEPMLILFGTGDSRRYCSADLRLLD